MKKILIIIVFAGFVITSAFANEPTRTTPSSTFPNDEVYNTCASNSTVELLVEANNIVYEICDYFNNSWADVAISVYCSFGGDVYTCTAYKITKIACGISGAVKLYIEGDINNSMKKVLKTGADIWKMTKTGDKKVTLTPSNMCPVN